MRGRPTLDRRTRQQSHLHSSSKPSNCHPCVCAALPPLQYQHQHCPCKLDTLLPPPPDLARALVAVTTQGDGEIARLQARASLAAKAQKREHQAELDTARWMKRLGNTDEENLRREKMLATTSVEVDLYVSKHSKVIEIEVSSQEEADKVLEEIARKKAAGEIAGDQEFRTINATDAVRDHDNAAAAAAAAAAAPLLTHC